MRKMRSAALPYFRSVIASRKVLIHQQELPLEKADAPEIDERDSAVPQQDDVAGMQVRVEQVVFEQLAEVYDTYRRRATFSGCTLFSACHCATRAGCSWQAWMYSVMKTPWTNSIVSTRLDDSRRNTRGT